AGGAERGDDPGPFGPFGEQDVEQDAGLDRIEETRADQAAGQQVPLGAGEVVDAGQYRAPAGPGGEHHRDLPGQGGQGRDRGGGYVPGAERPGDQPVEPAGRRPQQLAVVAQGQGYQADAYRPA